MRITTKSGRKLLVPTDAEDKAINEGIATDSDSPELGAEFFANAKPATEVLGTSAVKALAAKRGRGRPAGSIADETKAKVNLRLDQDVLERLAVRSVNHDCAFIRGTVKAKFLAKFATPSGTQRPAHRSGVAVVGPRKTQRAAAQSGSSSTYIVFYQPLVPRAKGYRRPRRRTDRTVAFRVLGLDFCNVLGAKDRRSATASSLKPHEGKETCLETVGAFLYREIASRERP